MNRLNLLVYNVLLKVASLLKIKLNKDTINASKINNQVIKKILRKNSNTVYGKQHDFKSIHNIDHYKSNVPLNDYYTLEKYITMMSLGQHDILLKGKTKLFGKTSGTTAKEKLIPMTKGSCLASGIYFGLIPHKIFNDNLNISKQYNKGVILYDMVVSGYTDAGIPITSASGGASIALKTAISHITTTPIDVMYMNDKYTSLYFHSIFALSDPNLMYISAIFISTILDFFRFIENTFNDLLEDIRLGKISDNIYLDDKLRKKIRKKLRPNPERATKLENEFKNGFEGFTKRIWPNLIVIQAITGASFSIYDEKVNYYTENTPIYSNGYGATEGIFGVNLNVSSVDYVLIPNSIFYEFIPIEDVAKENPETLLINDVQVGNSYELVITNFAGLYRYRLGDVIKVVDYYNNCPKIQFLYRRNVLLNILGEKTNELQLTNSINSTMSKLNLDLVDYTVMVDNTVSPSRYLFFIEINNVLDYNKFELLEDVLDLELGNSTQDYKGCRANNLLGKLKISLVKPNTFNNLKIYLINKGASKSQVKIPRVVTNGTVLDILLDSLIYTQENDDTI